MLSIDQLVEQFIPPAEQPYALLVGFEYEVFLFDPALGYRPVAYDGERGLDALLSRCATLARATRHPPEGSGRIANKLALPDGGQISLEPGGQFEFSSAPVGTFKGLLDQLTGFLKLIDTLCDEFSLHAFYGGVTPEHTLDQIGLIIPTERYRLMDAYFPRVGQMGRRMMRQSASIQVTFDFANVDLGVQLLRAALLASPFIAAPFCHAPFVDGAASSFRSYRGPIWADTDNARSGLPPGYARPDYSFADYAAHVVQAPMFFFETEDGLIDADCMTFDDFNRNGWRGREATVDDFNLHNSTIFTDVRLKRTVELRSVDAQDPQLVAPLLAFACGLLMCSNARKRTLDVLSPIDEAEHRQLPLLLSREGISGSVSGRATAAWIGELVELAEDGARNCFSDGALAAAQLKGLRQLVENGSTPADAVRQKFSTARDWLLSGRTFERGRFNDM